MESPVLRAATPADRERAVATVVAAFAADPAFRFFLPGEDEYAEQAPAFAGHLFDQRVAHGGVWVVDDGASVSMWERPGSVTAWPPRGLSTAVVERVNVYNAAVHPLLPTEPHWYLGVLATHPEHHGKRWGRLVMTPGLERAARDRLPAYLETVTATNVEIYTRSGWRVTGSTTIEGVHVRVLTHAGSDG